MAGYILIVYYMQTLISYPRPAGSKFRLVRPFTSHNTKKTNGIQYIKNSIGINLSSVVEEDTSVRRGWVSDRILRL